MNIIYSCTFLIFPLFLFCFFFFNDTATTEIYTLSLHDALPITDSSNQVLYQYLPGYSLCNVRSEEHTSELQSHHDLVCRLLLEKKKKIIKFHWLKTKKQTETELINRLLST